jgi:HSP20 family protein
MGRLLANEDTGFAILTHVPSLDVSETNNEVCVKVDLPGMKSDEIEISLDANILTISGERSEEKEEKGRTFHRVERKSGKFSRSVSLPCSVEDDSVMADYKNGTLTVTLPKSETAKTRKIKVKG